MKTASVSKLSALLVILAIGILSPLQAQNPEAQFQKGLMKEEGEGSLQEAIEVYNEVAVDESAGRPLQAKALLHIGLCYEKLGKEEATNTYRNIINNFPDQTETVKVAREKLALLNNADAQKNAKPRELSIRKVWEGPETLLGETSPDGRYLSFVDWDTGDLAIYELATGKTRRLTNKGTWDECQEYAEDSRWSPDGKQIVYSWWNEKETYELRIMELESSESRVLYSNEETNYMVPCDWSPDGKHILACVYYQDNAKQAAVLITVADGSMQVLKTLEDWPGKMCFTKNGRYIIFDQQQPANKSVRDIYLLTVEGGNEISLVEHPADDFLLGVAPDGESILFSSDRDGTPDTYLIKIEEGKPQGVPILVRTDLKENEALGFTPEGSFYYALSQELSDVYEAELDPETGSVISPPAKLETRFQGNNREPDYSPDGKHLAYVSVMHPAASNANFNASGGQVLIIRSLETQQEQKIVPDLHRMGYPRWTPDGKNIMVAEWSKLNTMGICQIEVETSHITSLLSPDEGFRLFGGHRCTPDGKTLYYGRFANNFRTCQIVARDLKSGEDKLIYESNKITHLSLSPDGLKLAIISRPRSANEWAMHVIPASGGEAKELFRFMQEEKISIGLSASNAWTHDGNFILFMMQDDNVEVPLWELCRIPAEGGEIEKLGITVPKNISNLTLHPDGRHISFSTEINPLPPAIWVMENFLPSD